MRTTRRPPAPTGSTLTVLALVVCLGLTSACQPSGGAHDAGTAAPVAPAEAATPGQVPGPARMGDGPGISVSEALASGLAGPLLVNGFLVVRGLEVTLCERLAESFPPQCAGPSVPVDGLDVNTVPGLELAGELRWTPAPIQLTGELRDGILVVSGTSQG